MSSTSSMPTLSAASQLVAPFLDDLRTLVNIDSGSYTPAGVARVADELEQRFTMDGWQVERIAGKEVGPQLIARRRGSGQGRILIVGHMDTVFSDGEAQRRPFTLSDGRAYGPGIFDMKSGLLVGMYALRVLAAMDEVPYEEITFLCNSDEEIGSPESTEVIARLATGQDAALVLEPTAQLERLTVTRKGVGMFRLGVTGIAAHAGVEPHKGRSAIIELAHRVLALHALNGAIEGVTLNVGVVSGGERTNVVADHAEALIDIRTTSPAATEQIIAAMRRVAAETTIAGTRAEISGSMAHEPFQQSERSARLFALAQEAATELGFSLRGEPTGGASDGNTTAALGIATLDGLGLVGGMAHNPGEYVEVASIASRVALLAGVIRRVGLGLLSL